MRYSVTYVGAAFMLLSLIAKTYDINLPYTEEQFSNLVEGAIGLVAFFVTLYGRYRAGGVNIIGLK